MTFNTNTNKLTSIFILKSLVTKAIDIHDAFILDDCWHQRHCVVTPGMAEIPHLGPLVLVAVIHENIPC